MAFNSSNYHINSGMRCIKYMLLTINFMFLMTSILLILVGTTIQAIYFDFQHFIDDYYLSPPALLIAVGSIMFIVASFGCFGAVKESTLLINVYGLFLMLIFILEMAASISAFALQGQVRTMLIRTMTDSIKNYRENEFNAASVDFMQSSLECCGVNSPTDWNGIFEETESNPSSLDVPPSCCAVFAPNSTKPGTGECDQFHEMGCLGRMQFLISQSAMLIATGATTVAFVQVLGVICAFMLAKTIRRTKSVRAARRWQLQQSLGILATNGKNLTDDTGYTQLSKTNASEPVTYTANSPSVN